VSACPIGGTFFDELCLLMNSYIVLRITLRVLRVGDNVLEFLVFFTFYLIICISHL